MKRHFEISLDCATCAMIVALICGAIVMVFKITHATCDGKVLAVHRADGTWMLCAPSEATNEQERTAKK